MSQTQNAEPGVMLMMTEEQRALVEQPLAMYREDTTHAYHQPGVSPYQLTGHFHMACGIPIPNAPIKPTVSLRERRLRFILEEFLELVEACGCEILLKDSHGVTKIAHEELTVRHLDLDESRYDVVETADALGDLNVVVNGMALELGLPMHFIDYEVYMSNMSKILPDGSVIRNGVTDGYKEGEPGYRADAPIGKILKPESFVQPNIPAVLVGYEKKEL